MSIVITLKVDKELNKISDFDITESVNDYGYDLGTILPREYGFECSHFLGGKTHLAIIGDIKNIIERKKLGWKAYQVDGITKECISKIMELYNISRETFNKEFRQTYAPITNENQHELIKKNKATMKLLEAMNSGKY